MLKSALLISLWYWSAREWTLAYFQKSILTTVATQSRNIGEEQGMWLLNPHVMCSKAHLEGKRNRKQCVRPCCISVPSKSDSWFVPGIWCILSEMDQHWTQLFFWPVGKVLLIKAMTKWKWWFQPVQMEFHRLEWYNFLDTDILLPSILKTFYKRKR